MVRWLLVMPVLRSVQGMTEATFLGTCSQGRVGQFADVDA